MNTRTNDSEAPGRKCCVICCETQLHCYLFYTCHARTTLKARETRPAEKDWSSTPSFFATSELSVAPSSGGAGVRHESEISAPRETGMNYDTIPVAQLESTRHHDRIDPDDTGPLTEVEA